MDETPRSNIKDRIFNFIKIYGEKLDITMVTHVIIYFLILVMFPGNNLFVNMMTVDSTISSVQFIKTLYEGKDDILNRNNMNKIYETDLLIRKIKEFISTKYEKHADKFKFNNEGYVNTIKKYVYYIIMQCLSWLFGIIFWGYMINIFNGILLVLSLPMCYITIISSIYFLKVFKIVTTCFKSVSVFILSKITAKIINNLAETCMDTHPKIDYNEMINFYEDFGNAVDTTLVFLKTVIVQTLIHYTKKTDNIFYYSLIEIFHRYQIESLLAQSSNESLDAKSKTIYEIVRTRKWNDFLKPKTVNIIFELYESKNNDMYARRMGVFFRNIKINITRLMTLWSISLLSPVLALCIDIYFTFFETRYNIKQHIFTYIIGACVLCGYNYFVGSFLIITSEIIMKPLIDYIEEKELITKYIIHSKEHIKYIILIPLIWKLGYISLIVPPLFQYINKQKILNILIQITTLLTLLSDNNFVHILFLTLLSLVINNLITNGITTDMPQININLIDNYLEGFGNNIVRRRVLELSKPVIRIVEQPVATTRANVCKYVSSYLWMK